MSLFVRRVLLVAFLLQGAVLRGRWAMFPMFVVAGSCSKTCGMCMTSQCAFHGKSPLHIGESSFNVASWELCFVVFLPMRRKECSCAERGATSFLRGYWRNTKQSSSPLVVVTSMTTTSRED